MELTSVQLAAVLARRQQTASYLAQRAAVQRDNQPLVPQQSQKSIVSQVAAATSGFRASE